MIHGGHQEQNLRGGTECVPLIVGMGKTERVADYINEQKVG